MESEISGGLGSDWQSKRSSQAELLSCKYSTWGMFNRESEPERESRIKRQAQLDEQRELEWQKWLKSEGDARLRLQREKEAFEKTPVGKINKAIETLNQLGDIIEAQLGGICQEGQVKEMGLKFKGAAESLSQKLEKLQTDRQAELEAKEVELLNINQQFESEIANLLASASQLFSPRSNA